MADAAPPVAVISKAVLNSAPDQLLSVPNLNLHNSQIVANENVGIVAGFTAHEQASLEGDITMDNSLRSISQTLSHSPINKDVNSLLSADNVHGQGDVNTVHVLHDQCCGNSEILLSSSKVPLLYNIYANCSRLRLI